MKTSWMIIIVCMISVMTIGLVNAIECNSTSVTDSCTVSTNLTLAGGQVFNVDDATDNGVVIINTNNVVFDCNGSTINGTQSASSRGIFANNKNNISIINCNIMNYHFNIRLLEGDNSTVANNNLSGAYIGVYAVSTDHLTIRDNYVFSNGSQPAGTPNGLSLDTDNNHTIIQGNIVDTYYYQIFVNGLAQNTTIKDNIVTNATGENLGRGIETRNGINNTRIFNNTVINPQRNGIVIGSDWAWIYNNTVTGFKHHGIDISCGVAPLHSSNIFAYQNYVYNDVISLYAGAYSTQAFVVCDNFNVTVYNNTVPYMYNNYSASTLIGGIAVDIQENGSSILIENNTFNNINGYCVQLKGNATVRNNNFNSCADTFLISSYETYWQESSIINNTVTSNSTIDYATQKSNLTIKGNFPSNTIFDLSAAGYINLTSAYYDIFIRNTSINITNQLSQYPYNDLKNVSNDVILVNNFNNYSLTLTSGQSVSVGNFNSSVCTYNIPPGTNGTTTNGTITVNISITDPDVAYINHTIRIYNDIGTLVAISNKNTTESQAQFSGLSTGNYYYNAIITENNSYSLTCSNVNVYYSTSGTSTNTCTAIGSAITGIGSIGTWLSVLIASIVGGIVIALFIRKESPSWELLPTTVMSIIMVALVLSIGVIMLGGLC